MKFRALAIDLDGTLLTPQETVSPRNRAAVLAALNAGYEIIIATARWYYMAKEVGAALGIRGPAIACSGAQVRRLGDADGAADVMDVRLPAGFAKDLYEICDRERCIATVALDTDVVVKMDGKADHAALAAVGIRAVRALASTADQVPRIALIQGTATSKNIVSALAPAWKEQVRFVESISSGGKTILTLTAVGADKGVALEAACLDLGLPPAEVVAIGDADNDIEMFRVAGASFVMGQATQAVQMAGTAVTATNAQDGVAVAIERLLEHGAGAFDPDRLGQ